MSVFGDLNRTNTNIQSKNAVKNLNTINKGLNSQSEKLSSGAKVNNIEDGAVAYMISAELEGKIAGLEQSIQYTDSSKMEEFYSEQAITYASARSRTIDTDFAKEQSEYIRLQILQKTATSALSQANNGPQTVLEFFK